jgi:hypothetical protein
LFDLIEYGAIFGIGPCLNQDENLESSTKSEDTLVQGDTFGVVEGSVET